VKEKGVTAAVGDLAYVGNGVAIFGEFDGGVVDEERVGRLAGEFGVDDFPRAAERMGGRRRCAAKAIYMLSFSNLSFSYLTYA
jgi:hypothetical protein